MSTYVNDLRLEEIGTGEASGTWGTKTNVSLELIGEAFGYGTEGITTNADTHTSTIADGATDPVRAMFVKYTGTLDSACTITIAPNTINRMQFIENATSGSQNIIISQGSGANITIPPGDVKAVYLDGAGSGAAVVDAFASLSVVDLKVQDDLTVTDDLTVNGDIDLAGSIDVDGTANLDVVDIDGAVDMASTLAVTGIVTLTDDLIIGDGKTIGSASDVDAITIASNGQLTLTQTLIGTALDISGDIDIDGTTNLDVVDIDGAVDMATTLTLAGNADFNGDLDVDGTTNLDAVDIDGAVQIDGTVTVGVDDTGLDVKFFGATSGSYLLWDESADSLLLTDSTPIKLGDSQDLEIYHDGSNSYVKDTGTGSLILATGGLFIQNAATNENMIRAVEDGAVTLYYDNAAKLDTVTGGINITGDTDTDTLTVSGNADLNGDLDVDGTTNLDAVDIDGAVQLDSTLSVGVDGTGHDVKFFGDTASAYMLWDQSTDDLILGGAAQLGIGTTTPAKPLQVKITADGTLVRLSRSGVCDWDVSIGNTSTLSGVGSGALEFLPQNSGTPNEFAIGKAGTTASLFHATIDGTTMSQQPAFLVRPASTQTNIATGSEITVVFGTEVLDVGGNFASNTFTAPVTGKYQLNLSLYTNAIDTASDYYIVAIKTSNRQYDNVLDPGVLASDPVYWNQGLSVLADMDANDTAHVFIQQESGTAQTDVATGSVFSGFLAC